MPRQFSASDGKRQIDISVGHSWRWRDQCRQREPLASATRRRRSMTPTTGRSLKHGHNLLATHHWCHPDNCGLDTQRRACLVLQNDRLKRRSWKRKAEVCKVHRVSSILGTCYAKLSI
jgi:hypothetical protein